jgi:hypothetical protein
LTLVLKFERPAEWGVLRKAATFVARLGIRARGDGVNELSIRFPTGSRIVGLPGNETTTPDSPRKLIDEGARVLEHVYRAMRPSLASVWMRSISVRL